MGIELIYDIVTAVCVALMAVLTAVWLPIIGWQVVIGLRGIFRLKRPKEKKEDKQYSFAVLVCARNEERVIGNLIDSINAQNYPADAYRVFLVADNCTDRTGDIAREKGATVLERHDTEHKGKGFALELATQYVNHNFPGVYDALLVMDADNLLDPDFMQGISDGLCCGFDVVTGWRCTKNPYDSWVSGCYDIYWTIVMRMFNAVRYSWGLSSMVHGTGFAVRSELLQGGWKTSTVTEDGEFSMLTRISDGSIALIQQARFYDEQPTRLRDFFTQFHRWEVGGVQCFKKLFRPAMAHCRDNPADGLDCLSFLSLPIGMAAMFLSFIPYVVLLAVSGMFGDVFWILAASALVGILSVIVLAIYGMAVEHRPVFRMWRSILLFPVFTLPMSVIAVGAVFRPRVEWKTIPHNSEVDMTDVGEIPPDPIIEKVEKVNSKIKIKTKRKRREKIV